MTLLVDRIETNHDLPLLVILIILLCCCFIISVNLTSSSGVSLGQFRSAKTTMDLIGIVYCVLEGIRRLYPGSKKIV